MASDNVVEEIRLHQDTIASDANSPLHLIREKELEISGRMLAAKREADEVVAAARRKGAEIVAEAEHAGGSSAKASAEAILAQAQEQAAELVSQAREEAESIKEAASARLAKAVELVTHVVTAE